VGTANNAGRGVSAEPTALQHADFWFVDSLVVPASVHDTQGRFVHANPAAERASGRTNADWRGRHYTDPIPPEVRESVVALFQRAVAGEPTEFETAFHDASGELRAVRAQHLPLRSGEKVVGILILAFDSRRPPAGVAGPEPRPHLTPRQREILELVESGLSTTEIAETLGLSIETVRNHLRNLMSELDAHSRLQALAAARRLGLLGPAALGPQPPTDAPDA
jgi:PAS domain S-box-containing protein